MGSTATAWSADQRALVDAALDALQGSDEVDFSITDVVERAGSNRAALYASFGSKDRLLLAAVAEAVRRTVAAADGHLQGASTPAAGLEAWVRVLLGRAGDPTASAWTLPFALNANRLLHRFPEAEHSIRLPLRQQLSALLPADTAEPPEQIAEAIFAMVMNVQAMHIARGTKIPAADVDVYVRCALRIAGLPPSGTGPARR
ncbi:MAG TPA: TetR/AcrR family transcriptional regulator [Mycobacteriales bacterium]|jgi:AcrR family transcriptional regulator|nr:TetR/AcrR family transcriptional regulator [Mycobacteriales bacterium]